MNIPANIITGQSGHDDPKSWDIALNVKAQEHRTPGELTNWSPKHESGNAFLGLITDKPLGHADDLAADKAIKLLDRIEGKPFFLAVGFVRPHMPMVAPKKYFDMYNREEMIAPKVSADDLDDVPEVHRNYKNNDFYGVTPELHKGLLQAYYASVSYMDSQAGRVLDALEQKGLADNTIIIFTSDHGFLLGEHNKYQKQHLFEESTRVPFIISIPWMKEQHGKAVEKITELIDLYPTLMELTNMKGPANLQGTSLKVLLEDVNSDQWKKKEAFTVSRKGGESLRTTDWRFTQWGHGETGYELYDLKNDPGEFTNLAGRKDYQDILKKMKNRLLQKRKSAGYKK